MKRRSLIQSVIGSSAAPSLGLSAGGSSKIIDTNVSLFHWPFRRLPLDRTERLIAKMKWLGISHAFAGSFDGMLHRNVSAVNRRLFEECRSHSELIPIGSINPSLPGWESDLRQCIDEFQMPGIRLHPNYHGYTLDDVRFEKVLQVAAENGLLVQIAIAFEDLRTQPEQLRVPDVDPAPLVERAIGKIQLLNWRPRGQVLEELVVRTEISLDTARVEGTDGVARLVMQMPRDRVAFGTHAPFLIPEASLIRVHESGLSRRTNDAVLYGTASALLKMA